MKHFRGIYIGVVLIVTICISVAWFTKRRLAALEPSGPNVIFNVERGTSLHKVARDLEEQGLADSMGFEWLTRFRGLTKEIQAGEYELSSALSAGEILLRLTQGKVVTYTLVIPEGFRATEIAKQLEDAELASSKDFLETVNDAGLVAKLGLEGTTLEGYLFPETYQFTRGLSSTQIVHAFTNQFHTAWSQIAPLAETSGLSMLEVVTLASLIEKETGLSQERIQISSVFRNRLKKRMRLEADPSVIYGIPNFDGNLTRKHLEDAENPYNTYQIRGLPPGPIANPGLDSLKASVSPADTDYLFFVARGDGTHQFSRSYRKHSEAVDRFQRGR